jgi:hypothetical protein
MVKDQRVRFFQAVSHQCRSAHRSARLQRLGWTALRSLRDSREKGSRPWPKGVEWEHTSESAAVEGSFSL